MDNKCKIVNLTPHEINIISETGNYYIPTSGVARCAVEKKPDGDINDIPINKTKFGKVEGLPAPSEGTIFIVSTLIAQAAPDRTDIFVPDDIVRDSQGKIIGCKALARV